MLLSDDPHRRPRRKDLIKVGDIPRPQNAVIPLGLFERWKFLAELDITALAVFRPQCLPPIIYFENTLLVNIGDWPAASEAEFDRCLALMESNDLDIGPRLPEDRFALVSLDEFCTRFDLNFWKTVPLAVKGLLPKPASMVFRTLYFRREDVEAWERRLPTLQPQTHADPSEMLA